MASTADNTKGADGVTSRVEAHVRPARTTARCYHAASLSAARLGLLLGLRVRGRLCDLRL